MARPMKPTVEKLLAGTPGNRKLPVETEVSVITNSRAPIELDKAQRKIWRRYAKPMVEAGMLTELNIRDLVRLCKF